MDLAEQQFPVDSGSLALDLLNTLRLEGGDVFDSIGGPASLLAWLDATGLGPTSGHLTELPRSPPGTRILLSEALRLREELLALFEARRAGTEVRPHMVYGLNRVLDAGPVRAQVYVASGGLRLLEHDAEEGLLAVLAPIAHDAARLLTEVDADRIRRCDAEDCRRWFVDTSKGGRRRWCSMARCGNRAKAARHRRKTEAG